MLRDSAKYTQHPESLIEVMDTGDCAVRAFAVAAGISYDRANVLLMAHGRVFRRGTSVRTMLDAAKAFVGERGMRTFLRADVRKQGIVTGFRYDIYTGLKVQCQKPKFSFPTVAEFQASHMQGRFLLWSAKHAFALVDGVYVDWGFKTRRQRVTGGIQFLD